jgi:hypothetical protein
MAGIVSSTSSTRFSAPGVSPFGISEKDEVSYGYVDTSLAG